MTVFDNHIDWNLRGISIFYIFCMSSTIGFNIQFKFPDAFPASKNFISTLIPLILRLYYRAHFGMIFHDFLINLPVNYKPPATSQYLHLISYCPMMKR
jgi:hypothetical protein